MNNKYRDRRTSTRKQDNAKHMPTHCSCCGASECKLHRVQTNTFYCPECLDLYRKDWKRDYLKGTTNT